MNYYYIDEIIAKLIEMRSDGYRYCHISEMKEHTDDDYTYPACLSFEGVEEGGLMFCDYEDIDCVPEEEISEYGYVDGSFPEHRFNLEFRTYQEKIEENID